jgi:amino acid transporter
MLFTLAGSTVAHVADVLFLTSLFAAMVAFHNTTSRYLFALGRDRVLPGILQRTSRGGAPKVASLVQSMVGLSVIVVYAVSGMDPMVKLFYWWGTTGATGILLLLTVASFAAMVFFARNHHGEPVTVRVIAPLVSGAALLVIVWLVLDNYSAMLGLPPGAAPAFWLPASYGVAALIGLVVVLVTKVARPDTYAGIVRNADRSAVVPAQRVGAHAAVPTGQAV